MTLLQSIMIAVFQGVTELFTVRSLGHTVILPVLLGWNIDQQSLQFLPFLVVLHLGTAGALLVYFRRDWIDLIKAALGRGARTRIGKDRHLLVLLVLGTLPAVILGLVLKRPSGICSARRARPRSFSS